MPNSPPKRPFHETARVRRARVLVIKLGALGDLVQALGPMAAIRRHHGGAHVVLLTTPPFVELARASGWFDEIWTDRRPSLLNAPAVLSLARRLNAGRFDRVYDLQTSDRSGFYCRLMGPPFGRRPEWSGIARGCSHPHANPRRDTMHTIERQAEQLVMAGVTEAPRVDLSWLTADIARFALPRPFVLMAPAGAAHRPEKRWPAESYGRLASRLAAIGVITALVGAESERDTMDAIKRHALYARDLSGATSIAEIAQLARAASAAIGNDTGPMHIVAGAGCPSLVLFSDASDPALCAPRAPADARPVTVIRKAPLDALGVDEVHAAFRRLLR
jgi:ADP-heptose:LPS heptosyltransferase